MDAFARRLLTWYRTHGRSLPWRGRVTPYAVWISEIMLQQTRVDAVIPFFKRWMTHFPNVRALAQASEREVLNYWEGLGYYGRARNLHRAARIVVQEHAGRLPRDPEALRKLPGIGAYTAGAISSIAFGEDVATLDGNLRRVLARVFDVRLAADSPAGEKILWRLAAEHLPKGRAGDYNQALMDLGATVCLPKNPRCAICPVAPICQARLLGFQSMRPVMGPRKAVPHRVQAAAVIIRRGRVLLALRPSSGLLGGMWEFPKGWVIGEPVRELPKILDSAYRLSVRLTSPLAVVRHAYTHFSVTVHAFRADLHSGKAGGPLKWIPIRELEEYPMGRIDRRIARELGG